MFPSLVRGLWWWGRRPLAVAFEDQHLRVQHVQARQHARANDAPVESIYAAPDPGEQYTPGSGFGLQEQQSSIHGAEEVGVGGLI